MAIDGNFAGGFSEGIQPLVSSMRQDRRIQSQNDFQQKLLKDRQTAESEIRNKQRDDRIANEAQAQKNFESRRVDRKDEFSISLLDKDRNLLERDVARQNRALDSTTTRLIGLNQKFQEGLRKIDAQFPNPNDPRKKPAIQALTDRFSNPIAALTDEANSLNSTVQGLEQKLGVSNDAIRDRLTGSSFERTLEGDAQSPLFPDTPEAAPEQTIFQEEGVRQKTLFDEQGAIKKAIVAESPSAVSSIPEGISEGSLGLAESSQRKKITDILTGNLDSAKVQNLEALLIRGGELGSKGLLDAASGKENSGAKIFSRSVASVIANPKLDAKLDTFISRKKKELETDIQGDAFVQALTGNIPLLERGSRDTLTKKATANKLGRKVKTIREGIDILQDRFRKNDKDMDREATFKLLQKFIDIQKAERNKTRVSDLARELGVR